jgi:phosphoserine phosphatase RsbU/P
MLKDVINNNKYFLVFAFFLLFFMRLTGDILLIAIGADHTSFTDIWKALTSSLLVLNIIVLILLYVNDLEYSDNIATTATFIKEYKLLLMFILELALIEFILPENFLMISKITDSIITNIIVFAVAALTFYSNTFIMRWYNRKRINKNSLIAATIILAMSYLLEIASVNYPEESTIIGITQVIIIIIGMLLVFMRLNSKSLVHSLNKAEKVKVLLFGIVVSTLSVILAGIINEKENFIGRCLHDFYEPLGMLCTTSFLYLFAISLRVTISTALSIPSSDIIDKRTSELSSITHLNKLVASTIDFNNLLSNVTHMVVSISKGSSSWVEITGKDGITNFPSKANINDDRLNEIYQKSDLKKMSYLVSQPTIIASMDKNPDFYKISFSYPELKSMALIPLIAGDDRIGTLIISHPEEYGFEQSDLSIFSAYSDNINVAFENARLLQDSIDKEHYKRELQLAKKMQRKLLPEKLPLIENYSIDAFSLTAEEVGGDYYDVIQMDEDNFCVLIGDVSGKGMNAAFYMAQLKGVVLACTGGTNSPVEILKRINSTVYNNIDRHVFITISCLVINQKTGTIRLARGGHTPVIQRISGKYSLLVPRGIGIGLSPEEVFAKNIEELELNLNPNDLILLFTDGLNELRSISGEELGFEMIIDFCRNSNFSSASELNAALKGQVREYLGDTELNDDLTVVSIIFL